MNEHRPTASPAASLGALLARAARWRPHPGRAIAHDAVVDNLSNEAGLTARYAVMAGLSCAIAILGLLLSSPAVIIGAMLLSPLMSPIVLLGFSLTLLDRRRALRSLEAIAVGSLLSVALSALLVWLSPLQQITPEIAARTHPNLFDLLVAVFSGVAGAYAVAQHKGEAMVGVAIATALMPPLAVTGFGLATANWTVAEGAAGLFMTNLLAIALTASVVAKVFGFGSHATWRDTMWQAASIIAVFAVLSIPLGLSLMQIAREAVQTGDVRATLAAYFDEPESRVYGVNVSFPRDQPVRVEALVLSRHPQRQAEAALQAALARKLGRPVQLTLSQVPSRADGEIDAQAIADLSRRMEEIASARTPPPPPAPDLAAIAARRLGAAPSDISIDKAAKRFVLHAGRLTPARLTALRSSSAALLREEPGWRFVLRLDGQPLPPVTFAQGSTAPDDNAKALIASIAWALSAADVRAVRVEGHSDSAGRSHAANRAAALRRAQAVAEALAAYGIAATPTAVYPVADQSAREREDGRAQFRSADVIPS